MPFQLNDKIKNLSPYDPITGNYPIRLDANESFLAPDEPTLEAITRAVQGAAFNRYPDPYAGELCRGFAAFYGVDPQLCVAGNGSDELLSLLAQAFLQKGEKLLSFTPDFSMYRFYGTISETEQVVLEKSAALQLDVEAAIQTAAQQDVKLILFSNPCNPTSLGMSRADVLRLVEHTQALVVVDEAYMDFYDQSVLDCVAEYENLVVLRTCSKAIGMASLRLGFAVANETVIRAFRAVKSPYNVNALSQAIGTVVFSEPEKLRKGICSICASRDSLKAGLQALQLPQIVCLGADANFLYCSAQNAEALFAFLMNRGIIIRSFGEHLRITAGKPEENSALLQAVQTFYERGAGV